MQCEHVLHSIMYPLGLESESESVHEGVSFSVNESLQPVLYAYSALASDFSKTEISVSGIQDNRSCEPHTVSVLHFHCSSVGLQDITLSPLSFNIKGYLFRTSQRLFTLT